MFFGGISCIKCDNFLFQSFVFIHLESGPSPPSVGGGFPVVGGFGGSEPVDHEQKMIAAVATQQFLQTVESVAGSDCSHRLTLLEIVEFRRQIVAGTNFRFI